MFVHRWLALLAVPAATLALTTPAMASTATPAASHAKASGTEIILAHTPFGWSLAVGSGPYKNYTLYFISSDNPPSYGCTTVVVSLPGAPPGATCTGPSNDKNAEWPAITTNGKPVAGPASAGRCSAASIASTSGGRSPTPGTRCTCSTRHQARSPARAGSSPDRCCRPGTGSGG